MEKNLDISALVAGICNEIDYSGVVLIKKDGETILQKASGYLNRAEELVNTMTTRFGIASGCKLFTAVGICQLVEKGMLTFETKLKDCLDIQYPHFDDDITIHHLLTHTSGIPDYFDESVMENFEDLWNERPMYKISCLKDFLPMFQNQEMMFNPGERFHYNNAGFIVLGLVIEQSTGLSFTDYIQAHVFERCGMKASGYYSLDSLPRNTALGYIDHEDGTWKTNSYSIPIKGGADGGAFINAEDMVRFWDALLDYRLMSEDVTNKLLTPHVCEKDEEFYGYGIWISKRDKEIYKYHVMGYDPGVSFHSSFYPQSGVTAVMTSNKSRGPYKIVKAVEEYIK